MNTQNTEDILFKNDSWVFSYRVAGICVHNGRVLLQKPADDPTYAFPGGHVSFGETNAETLRREFREEIGAEIKVGELKWVAEVFFPRGNKTCHQICLYYLVTLLDDRTPREGSFTATEQLEGRTFPLGFHWVPLEEANHCELYPTQCRKLLSSLSGGPVHFVYQE